MNASICTEDFINNHFERHNLLQQTFSYNPAQNHFFNNTFFLKEIKFLILTSVNFYTIFLLNKPPR